MKKFIENSELKNRIVSIVLMCDDPDQFYYDVTDDEDPITNVIDFVSGCDFCGADVTHVTIDERTHTTYNNINRVARDINIGENVFNVVSEEAFEHIMMHMDFTKTMTTDELIMQADEHFVYFRDRVGDGGVRLIQID